jgi:hypothetical protein
VGGRVSAATSRTSGTLNEMQRAPWIHPIVISSGTAPCNHPVSGNGITGWMVAISDQKEDGSDGQGQACWLLVVSHLVRHFLRDCCGCGCRGDPGLHRAGGRSDPALSRVVKKGASRHHGEDRPGLHGNRDCQAPGGAGLSPGGPRLGPGRDQPPRCWTKSDRSPPTPPSERRRCPRNSRMAATAPVGGD